MKTLRSALLVVLSVLAAAACTKKPVMPEFGTAVLDTLLASPGGAACRIEYRYVSILNADASPTLQAVEEANLNYFYQLEGFTGSAADAARAALREIDAEYVQDLPAAYADTDFEISADAEAAVVDSLIVYTISRSSFTGGAHGMYGIECHTYSLAEGYELTAADLVGEERLPRLGALIRAKLYEEYEARNDEELTDKGFFPEYIAVTDNFRVTREGVTFFYNPYEIGCYALGLVEVEIGRKELEQL